MIHSLLYFQPFLLILYNVQPLAYRLRVSSSTHTELFMSQCFKTFSLFSSLNVEKRLKHVGEHASCFTWCDSSFLKLLIFVHPALLFHIYVVFFFCVWNVWTSFQLLLPAQVCFFFFQFFFLRGGASSPDVNKNLFFFFFPELFSFHVFKTRPTLLKSWRVGSVTDLNPTFIPDERRPGLE